VQVSIGNWNLDHAKQLERREGIRSVLQRERADIWVLTESRDSVCPGDGYRLVAKSSPGVRDDADERWVSIWTHLPDMGERKTRDDEFSACALLVLPSGARMAVFGTVLPWCGQRWRDHRSAGGAAFEAALTTQAADWRELAAEPGIDGLCVAGDFNQDLSDRHYYWSSVTRESLRATLSDCGLRALTAHPADPVRILGAGERACIDHICLSAHVAARQHGSPRAWEPRWNDMVLSDHPGILVSVHDA